MSIKEFFKKYSAFVALGVVLALLIASVAMSCIAFSASRKTSSALETLSQDYLNFSTRVSLQLDQISDNVEFMKDFVVSSAGSVQLGDTYINHPSAYGDHSKIKK